MDKESEDSRSSASGTKGGAGDSSVKSKKSKKKCKAVSQSQGPASDSSTDEEPEPRAEKWSCSVCTFENSAGDFRCGMCCVRKGTSTRKPRQVQAQQVARQQQQIQQQALKATARAKDENRNDRKRPASPSSSIGAGSTSSESKRRNSDVDTLVSPGPSKGQKDGKKIKKGVKGQKEETSDNSHEKEEKKEKKVKKDGKKQGVGCKKFRLRNMDHNNCESKAVTVNNVTVIITEFKPMRKEKKSTKGKTGDANGQNMSTAGNSVKKENRESDKKDVISKKKTGKKSLPTPASPAAAIHQHQTNHCSSETRNGSEVLSSHK